MALVNGEGGFKDFESGEAYASHESGWVFMTDDDLKIVSAGGGVRRYMPLPDELDPILAASFSPDASMVAMAGRFGVVVLDRDSEELIELSPVFPADWVTWSSDSRFVLARHRAVSTSTTSSRERPIKFSPGGRLPLLRYSPQVFPRSPLNDACHPS